MSRGYAPTPTNNLFCNYLDSIKNIYSGKKGGNSIVLKQKRLTVNQILKENDQPEHLFQTANMLVQRDVDLFNPETKYNE